MLKKLLMFAVFGLLLAPSAAFAEKTEEGQSDNGTKLQIADTYDLSVSVTATRTERDLMDVPVSMSVVTEKQIDRAPQSSVGELLKNVPGVYLSDLANTSGSRKMVSLRGFGQNGTIIIIDGVRQHFPASVNAWNTFSIDPSEIESIEVIKGASSVLYGSDGLGGVIKITTKKGKDKAIGGSLKTRYTSSDNSFTPYASVFGETKGFNYRISASRVDADNRRAYDREVLHNTERTFEDYSAHLGYKWNKGEVTFSAERFNEWIELANTMTVDGFIQQRPLDQVTSLSDRFYKRNTYTLGFVQRDITDNLDRLTINGSWQKLQDGWTTTVLATNTPDYDSHEVSKSYSGSIQTDWTFFNSHAVSLGLDYTNNDTDIEVIQPTRVRDYNANQKTVALFIQDEWTLFDSLTILPGLRQTWTDSEFDKTARNTGPERTGSKSYSKLVGSLGAVYRGIDNLALRANYSQGFKTPNINQLYADGWNTLSNPDLKPEKSDNYEVGLRYDDGTLVADAALFYGEYKDAITSIQVASDMWQQLNANERESYGIEFYTGYRIHRLGLTPYISGTAIRTEMTYADGFKTTDVGSPKLWGKAGVKWEKYFSDSFNVFSDLGVRYTDIFHQRYGSSSTVYTTQARRMIDLSFGVEGETAYGKYNLAANLENITDENFKSSSELASGFLATITAGIEF